MNDEGPTDALPLEALVLPAVWFGVTCGDVDRREDLCYMRENALSPPKPGYVVVPQYFWGADDRWFQAVDIRKVRRAPFLMRFAGADDLMIAEYRLKELASAPAEWLSFYRHLSEIVPIRTQDPIKVRASRRALRSACKTSLGLSAWIEEHLKIRPKHGY